MAMYYYARKLQKSERSKESKVLPPAPMSNMVNGSSSTCSSTESPVCSSSVVASASASALAPTSTSTVTTTAHVVGATALPLPLQLTVATDSGPSSCQNPFLLSLNQRSLHQNVASSSSADDSSWEDALVFHDTNLVCGSLSSLIQHLVPTEGYYPDRAFIFAFLLSSRLFIHPHELLGRVIRLTLPTTSQSPQHRAMSSLMALHPFQASSTSSNSTTTSASNSSCATGATAIRQYDPNVPHMVRLLGDWTQLFPYDFRDEQMMAHVRNITQRCVTEHPPIRKEVSQLLTELLARLTALEKYEDSMNTDAALGDPLTQPPLMSICPSPMILAQQLTHIELERLKNIGPEEFVQAFVKDINQSESHFVKEVKKTRNLEYYVQWFNRLSYFVATEIVKVPKKKNRIRTVEYWIETGRHCYNIGNFNSVMAIIAGLNIGPVGRLKKTWNKVCTAQLSMLENNMDPSNNFASYRSTLKAAVWRSAGADERQKIVIPFFSLLVKDLYFLNEACASKLANGYVNFEKIWQFAKQVTEIMAWQQIKCTFPKVPSVLDALNNAPVLSSDNALSLASYECEGADNSHEKERLKYLRKEEASSSTSTMSDNSPQHRKHFRKPKKLLQNSTAGALTSTSTSSSTKAMPMMTTPGVLTSAFVSSTSTLTLVPDLAHTSALLFHTGTGTAKSSDRIKQESDDTSPNPNPNPNPNLELDHFNRISINPG